MKPLTKKAVRAAIVAAARPFGLNGYDFLRAVLIYCRDSMTAQDLENALRFNGQLKKLDRAQADMIRRDYRFS